MNSNNYELEKLKNERNNIENQFVIFKLKYAENADKMQVLEDKIEIYENKINLITKTIKTKDEIIQKLINDIEQYKTLRSSKKMLFNNSLLKGSQSSRDILFNKDATVLGITAKSPNQVLKSNNIENDTIFLSSHCTNYKEYNTSLPTSPEKTIKSFVFKDDDDNNEYVTKTNNSINNNKNIKIRKNSENDGNNSDNSASLRTNKGVKTNKGFVSIIKNIFGSNKKQ